MRFRMNFGIVKTILLGVVALGALAIVGLDIAMLVGTGSIATHSASDTAIACVSLCAAVIIAVGALLVIFNSSYTFKKEYMAATLGIFVDKIRYEEIVCFKQNSVTKELYLITQGLKPSDGQISFRLNIAVDKESEFISQMREHIGDIVVDVFTPEDKNQDNNKH